MKLDLRFEIKMGKNWFDMKQWELNSDVTS